MTKKFMMFLISLSSFLFAALAHAEPAYYVQNSNSNIRSEPTFGAKVIAKVAKGQALTPISKQGRWIKVKVDGKEGYISALMVSTQPPMSKQTVVQEQAEEARPTARRRASSYTSAAAARGLTEEEKKREGITDTSDFNAVKKMEALKVAPEEVNKFKETGK